MGEDCGAVEEETYPNRHSFGAVDSPVLVLRQTLNLNKVRATAQRTI